MNLHSVEYDHFLTWLFSLNRPNSVDALKEEKCEGVKKIKANPLNKKVLLILCLDLIIEIVFAQILSVWPHYFLDTDFFW